MLVGAGSPRPAQAADFPSDFAQPSRAVQPKFRWWWPNALVDNAEIAREIDQMADAGFGGAEIADVHHRRSPALDPAGHGWGTQAWVDAMQAALERAKARGMTIDLSVGPAGRPPSRGSRPTAPRRDQGARLRRATVTGGQTFSGPAPAAGRRAQRRRDQKKLLYVQAAKVTTAGNPPTTAYTLDRATLQNLTPDGDGTSASPRPTAATGS